MMKLVRSMRYVAILLLPRRLITITPTSYWRVQSSNYSLHYKSKICAFLDALRFPFDGYIIFKHLVDKMLLDKIENDSLEGMITQIFLFFRIRA